MPLTAIALNCTLKTSEETTSTDKLLREVISELEKLDVSGEIVRIVDHDIKPGVTSDEGSGDDWPALRKKILSADILVFGTPIWLGQPSSVAKRVLERMNAFFSEADNKKRMPSFGKIAVVAIVGNEDGAHHCGAGNGSHGLQGSGQAVRQDNRDNADAGVERRPSRKFAQVSPLQRHLSEAIESCRRQPWQVISQ